MYKHPTHRILDVLEDLMSLTQDALEGEVNHRLLEEAMGQAQDLINDCSPQVEKLDDLVQLLTKTADGTFSLAGARVTRSGGYQVGGDPLVPPLVNPSREDLVAWVERARSVYGSSRSHYLGKWTDKAGGVHYDVSQYVVGYYDALFLGRERREEAIWGWGEDQALPCRREP